MQIMQQRSEYGMKDKLGEVHVTDDFNTSVGENNICS